MKQTSVEASCCLWPSVAFTKASWSPEKRVATKLPLWVQATDTAAHFCRFVLLGVLLLPSPYIPLSGAVLQFRRPNVCHVINSEAVLMYEACMCVLMLLMVAAWARSGLQSTQLRFSFLWGAGLYWRGQGTDKSTSTCPPGWRTGCRAANAA